MPDVDTGIGIIGVEIRADGTRSEATWGGTGRNEYASLGVAGGPLRFAGTANNDGTGWVDGKGDRKATRSHPDDLATSRQIDEASVAVINALDADIPSDGDDVADATLDMERAKTDALRKHAVNVEEQLDKIYDEITQRQADGF